jgi:Uma2 family endonuclease
MRVTSAHRVTSATAQQSRPPLRARFAGGLKVDIAKWVVDLPSFRRWAWSEDFPQSGRIDLIDDTIWVDMTMEEFFTHNQVKTEFGFVLTELIRAQDLGYWVGDRMRITNPRARLSVEPDSAFASYETVQSGKLKMVEGKRGVMELTCVPDMVLEVVSRTSVGKDTKVLFATYARSGIPEYWLVDVRGKELSFEIYRHGADGYAAVKKSRGWVRLEVFDREFRLTRATDKLGKPKFVLEVRE